MDRPDLQDQRVLLVPAVLRDLQVRQDQQELESLDHLVLPVPRGLLARRELARPDLQVRRDQQGPQDPRVLQARQDLRVPQDQRVAQVRPDPQDLLDRRDRRVLLE